MATKRNIWLSKLCVYDESLFDMKMHRERACYHRGSLAVAIILSIKAVPCTVLYAIFIVNVVNMNWKELGNIKKMCGDIKRKKPKEN